ncbi:MAG: 50S ribosomal protein L30 [Nitrospinota bacterium]
MAGQVRITLRKSISGSKPVHREALRGLGLRKLNQSVVRRDNPSIRGLIFKVKHLVEVEEGA